MLFLFHHKNEMPSARKKPSTRCFEQVMTSELEDILSQLLLHYLRTSIHFLISMKTHKNCNLPANTIKNSWHTTLRQ